MFGKKVTAVNKKENISEQGADSIISTPAIKDEDVHVMPSKFVALTPDIKKSGAKTMATVLGLLLLLLAMILGGAAWYILSKKKTAVNTNQNTNTNQVVVNQNTNTNTNSNINNQNINDTINSIINNANNNQNINTNINNNVNNIIVEPSDNPDSDNDNLTLLEESLYGTNKDLDDTDKDGYKDGAELLNLYDPTQAGQPLAGSNLVKIYQNDNFSYQLLVPKKWVVQSVDDERRQLNFVPDAATGEIIVIKVMDNTGHLELADWQKSLLAGKALENYRIANFSAVKTTDGKQVLFVNYDNVFMITYDQGASLNKNFATTFNMMLKTFALNIKEISN